MIVRGEDDDEGIEVLQQALPHHDHPGYPPPWAVKDSWGDFWAAIWGAIASLIIDRLLLGIMVRSAARSTTQRNPLPTNPLPIDPRPQYPSTQSYLRTRYPSTQYPTTRYPSTQSRCSYLATIIFTIHSSIPISPSPPQHQRIDSMPHTH